MQPLRPRGKSPADRQFSNAAERRDSSLERLHSRELFSSLLPHDMKSLKGKVFGNVPSRINGDMVNLNHSERDGSSAPILDAARQICQLAANLGSGGLSVPGLQAAGLLGMQIIDIVKTIKNNREDCEELVQGISKLLQPIVVTLEDRTDTDIDPRLKNDLHRFKADLEKIRDILATQSNRKTLKRVIYYVDDSKNISKCKELVNNSFRTFQVYTSISLRMDMSLLQASVQTRQTFINDPPAYTEVHGSQSSISTVSNAQHGADNLPATPPPEAQPEAPEIFYGRDEIVDRIVRLFQDKEQTRVTLLGSGGIGKTSIGLHVFHHLNISSQYGDERYFVGCDAFTSADDLGKGILKALGASYSPSESVTTTLHRVLKSSAPTLVFVDNFESLWETEANRQNLENLLKKICAIRHVSLMVSMRGSDPPLCIVWSREEHIPPLTLQSARQVFLTINPLDDFHSESLDLLLGEMDYIPLAIHLLAKAGRGDSLSYLINRWRDERTRLLHGHNHRLESIEVSISLSLAALSKTGNADAIQLLGILSLLPDGLHRWEEQLPEIACRLDNVHHLFRQLRQTSLVILDGHRAHVLSPIRYYILHNHPPDTPHILALERYYWDLVRIYGAVNPGPGFPKSRRILEPEMGNLTAIIREAISSRPSADLIDTILDLTYFLSCTIPSAYLLEESAEMVETLGTPYQQGMAWRWLGDIRFLQARYVEAEHNLRVARAQLLGVGAASAVARCSQMLGLIFAHQSRYNDAWASLAEAREQFDNEGGIYGATQCLQTMGTILYSTSRYSEAWEKLMEARDQFLFIGEVYGAATCLYILGYIHSRQSRYTEASGLTIEAGQRLVEIGSTPGAASCTESLGNIRCSQSRYVEASELLTEAKAQFMQINDMLGASRCLNSLGEVLHGDLCYKEAYASLVEAREYFVTKGNAHDAATNLRLLGTTLSCQGQHDEASASLIQARDNLLEIGDIHQAVMCLQHVGDNLYLQNRLTEASQVLHDARNQLIELGDRHHGAQCSQSIGKIYLKQGKYEEALEEVTVAKRNLVEIGLPKEEEECSRLLEKIAAVKT